MIPVKMTSNNETIRKAVHDFGQRWGIDVVGPVLYEQMGLWAKDCALKFPPSADFKHSYSEYQRQVTGEIKRVVVPTDIADRVGKEVELGGEPYQFIRRSDGKVRFIPKALWRPNASPESIEEWYDPLRNETTGHLDGKKLLALWSKSKRSGVYTGKASKRFKHGRYPIDNRLHTNPGALSAFIRHKKSHIGQLKSGWLRGMDHFGRMAGRTIDINKHWITRHRPKMLGSFGGKIDANGNGEVYATNKVRWAHRFRHIVDGTVRTRRLDIMKHLAKRMKLVLHQSGFARATGRAAA